MQEEQNKTESFQFNESKQKAETEYLLSNTEHVDEMKHCQSYPPASV